MPARITAVGGYVPPDVISNQDLSQRCGKTASWIRDRTGIDERRWAAPGVPTSDLALYAVEDLARRAPAVLDGVSMILLATSTPDRPQPATAAILGRKLGLDGVPACDINSVCAGSLFALQIAAAMTDAGGGKILVVAADKYSDILEPTDPTTVTLFGDGAGAMIVEPGTDPTSGLLSMLTRTEGEFADLVTVRAGGSEFPTSAVALDFRFQMQGREVRRFVLDRLPPLLDAACEEAGISRADLHALIPHQANPRLLLDLAATMDISPDLIPLPGKQHGNCAAASVPLTLLAADKAGMLKPGRPVALCAVGGGMSLAAGIYVP
jgi:3-oxoacyl-[acyl-carrier-protein] synthase-3